MVKQLVFFILLLLSSSALSTQLPLEHFTRHGDYLDMQLSPDGKHIVARAKADNKIFFIVLDASTMKLVGGVRPRANDSLHSVEWINNERLVYQYAEKQLGFDAPVPTGELFAVNLDSSKDAILFGYRAGNEKTGSRIASRKDTTASAEIISYLPHDEKHILIAEYPFEIKGNTLYNTKVKPPIISMLNVYSGRKRKVENIPFKAAKVFATDNGDINFVRYRDEEGLTQSAYRATKSDEWQNLEDIIGADYAPISLSSDGKFLYLTNVQGEAQLHSIFELNLDTNEISPLFPDIETDVMFEHLVWDAEIEAPVVAVTSPTQHRYHYAKGKTDSAIVKWHKMLSASFQGQLVTIPSQSADGETLLVHVRSDINPGEYYLFNTKAKNANFIWANRSWLNPNTLAQANPFSFQTSDGLTVHGQVTLPNEINSGEKVPFITMIHGGPHGPFDDELFDSEVQLFANRGFAVVQVNFRGSGGYGEVFEAKGYRKWGTDMIRDITEGTVAAASEFPIDVDRACVYGASYGGYAAMMSAVREPELFKCVVGYVGLYNLSYFFTESDVAENYGGMAYLERVLGTDEEVLRSNSPVYFADQIQANVMLIHGDKDIRVPVINAESMLEALEDAGKTAEYLNFRQSGHGVYSEKGRYQLYEAALSFFNENIGQ